MVSWIVLLSVCIVPLLLPCTTHMIKLANLMLYLSTFHLRTECLRFHRDPKQNLRTRVPKALELKCESM